MPGSIPRYAQIARLTGAAASDSQDAVAAAALPEYLKQLNARLGIGRLRDFIKADRKVFEEKRPAMAEAALASGSPQNNPIIPSAAEIIELYGRVW